MGVATRHRNCFDAHRDHRTPLGAHPPAGIRRDRTRRRPSRPRPAGGGARSAPFRRGRQHVSGSAWIRPRARARHDGTSVRRESARALRLRRGARLRHRPRPHVGRSPVQRADPRPARRRHQPRTVPPASARPLSIRDAASQGHRDLTRACCIGTRRADCPGDPPRHRRRPHGVQRVARRQLPVPRTHVRRQGRPPRGPDRARRGRPATDRREAARTGGVRVLRHARQAAARRRHRVRRRARRFGEARCPRGRPRAAQPDQLGGAVRARHGRGPGLRDARPRVSHAVRHPRSWSTASRATCATTNAPWHGGSPRWTGWTASAAGWRRRRASPRAAWSRSTWSSTGSWRRAAAPRPDPQPGRRGPGLAAAGE